MFIIAQNDLVSVLQTAVGPVILISGVGLLLLSMTNRLARTIDRARELSDQLPNDEARAKDQLAILWVRARLQRGAILLASVSALCAAFLIIVLFLTVLLNVSMGWLVGALFICCMVSLIGSLMLFIREVNQTLEALRLELRQHKKRDV